MTAAANREGVRFGLIGTGFGARVQLPAFAQVDGVKVVAVCSANHARAGEVAQRFGIPWATDDYVDLVERDDIDVVSVCTPPEMHHEMTLAALGAGKHVLCEKPFALTVAQCRAMVEAERSAERIGAIDHEFRYTPTHRHLRRLVRDGFLGELRLVHCSVLSNAAVDPTREPHWFTWVAERRRGGGMLNGLLTHHIDLVRSIFGDLDDVQSQWAILLPDRPLLPFEYRDGDPIGPATPIAGRRPVDVDDTVTMQGRIGGGLVSITASWALHAASGNRIEAYGTHGSLVVTATGEILGARAGESALRPLELPSDLAPRFTGPGNVPAFAELVDDLARCVEDPARQGMFARFSDGVAVQAMVERILEQPPAVDATASLER